MGRVTAGHRSVGVTSEPYRRYQVLAEGELFTLGPGGDEDPECLIEDLVSRNPGAVALFASSTLRGALGTTSDAETIPAESLSPGIDTQVDTLFICNRDGTAGSGAVSLTGSRTLLNNSGKTPPCHSGHGCNAFLIPAVDSDASTVTRTVYTRRTVVHVGVYSKSVRTLTGTYLLTVQVRNAKGVVRNLLAAATFNLETLVAKTLSAPTLTTNLTDLVLEVGDTVEVIATSDNTLSAGDLMVAVETTPL